jgi:hypothetical protein
MMDFGRMGTWGMGWMGILFWVVLILVIAALIKYLFGDSDDR